MEYLVKKGTGAETFYAVDVHSFAVPSRGHVVSSWSKDPNDARRFTSPHVAASVASRNGDGCRVMEVSDMVDTIATHKAPAKRTTAKKKK